MAHLGYFREEYVGRRRWLDDPAYADLVALCQSLPGPASSQVIFGIGLATRGIAGGLACWLGFTLPSALIMMACGYGAACMGVLSSRGMAGGTQDRRGRGRGAGGMEYGHSTLPGPRRGSPWRSSRRWRCC